DDLVTGVQTCALPISLPAFSFWNHATAFGWMWLVLLVFFCVEGLYTQRRSMWNEVGHVVKAIGLGVTAVLAAAALAQLSPGVSQIGRASCRERGWVEV